jgi:hypothetical protein
MAVVIDQMESTVDAGSTRAPVAAPERGHDSESPSARRDEIVAGLRELQLRRQRLKAD